MTVIIIDGELSEIRLIDSPYFVGESFLFLQAPSTQKEEIVMSLFTGSAVALVTPFFEDGEIDYPSFKRLIEWQLEEGTDAFVICGTTGEASTLSEKEHIDVIRYAVNEIKNRAIVIAGTGANDTKTALELSLLAQEAGVDGLLLVTPYYNKATQNGLIRYFSEVANAVTLPIILYNVPSRTGCNILPETVAYLAKNIKNIVGIKEASGDISQVAKIASLLVGEAFDIYSGNDDQNLPILSLGGKGVISVLANIAPRATHDLVMSYLTGDVEKARLLQLEAFGLIEALFCEVNPIPVKKATSLLGFGTSTLRSPLYEIEPANALRLENEMRKFNLLS